MSHRANAARALLSEVPKVERPPRKSERTRGAILAAALDYLWTHPFRDMTVATLMSPTSASRSAFYRYFRDLHELMETLLVSLEARILEVARPWFAGGDDPVEELQQSLRGLVEVCYQHGPILRAVSEAATEDEQLEKAWNAFLGRFDDAVANRIDEQQLSGLIRDLESRPVAVALNRMDASVLIHAFGRRPRQSPEPVLAAIREIWCATLYPDSIKQEC